MPRIEEARSRYVSKKLHRDPGKRMIRDVELFQDVKTALQNPVRAHLDCSGRRKNFGFTRRGGVSIALEDPSAKPKRESRKRFLSRESGRLHD